MWVLLAFDAAAALFFVLRPGGDAALAHRWSSVLERPARSFGLLVALSAAVYLPMAAAFNPVHWTAVGPFTFQTSRLLHYALYFFCGVVLGAFGLERGLLATDGRLARRWALWVGAAFLAYVLAVGATLAAVAPGAGPVTRAIAAFGFVLSCAASSFAMLALFLRLARARMAVGESLRENAYGIYLVHYAFVSWLQYAVRPLSFPPLAKCAFVFGGAVGLSWATTAALRRLPALRRIL